MTGLANFAYIGVCHFQYLEKFVDRDIHTDISWYHKCMIYLLKCQSRQLMHCDTLKQDNDSTVRGDGGSRVGEVRAGTTSPMPEHKGFKLQ